MGGRLRRGGMKALAALQQRRWFRRLAAWARRHVAVREARQDELAQVQHLAGGLATAPSLPGQRLTTFVAVSEPSLGGGGRREARPRLRRLLGCSQLLCNPDTEGILYPGVWLAFVLVEPKARGAGLGMRLAFAVVEAAQTQGAARLLLVVDEDNRRAVELYEKLGFARIDFAPLRETLARLEAKRGVGRLVMAKELGPPAP